MTITQDSGGTALLNEITDIDISDDNQASNTWCNHDNEVNVTEELEIRFQVRNNGQLTATNVSATLSLPSGDLSCCNITDDSGGFPDIPPGETRWCNGVFDFWVYCMPSDQELDFTLTVNYDYFGGSDSREIDSRIDVYDEPIPIIDSAVLEVRGHRSAGAGALSDLTLYYCSDYWNESGNCGTNNGGTWNNDGYGTIGGTWQPIYFDADEMIDRWLITEALDNYGFMIKAGYTGSGYGFQIGTSESSNRPELTINYHWAGESGQYVTYIGTGDTMDLEYWWCDSSNNGCTSESSGSVVVGRYPGDCPGAGDRTQDMKIHFDIRESDF